MVLLCQNFRRYHQRRLMTVFHRQIGGGRSHHGLAAAHIALHQTVHGRTPSQVHPDLFDCPLLGTGEDKGQRLFKGC